MLVFFYWIVSIRSCDGTLTFPSMDRLIVRIVGGCFRERRRKSRRIVKKREEK